MTSQVDSEFVRTVGENVRKMRRQRGMTVQQLAEASGVSRRMLTQIELGQANPSLITVDKIARTLATDFASLTQTGDDEALSVTPADRATVVWSSVSGGRALLHVSAQERGGPELWTWRLTPADRYRALPDTPGSEELFLVTEGQLTIETVDAATATLQAGDAARLASDREYTYVNRGQRDCSFVRIVRVRP